MCYLFDYHLLIHEITVQTQERPRTFGYSVFCWKRSLLAGINFQYKHAHTCIHFYKSLETFLLFVLWMLLSLISLILILSYWFLQELDQPPNSLTTSREFLNSHILDNFSLHIQFLVKCTTLSSIHWKSVAFANCPLWTPLRETRVEHQAISKCISEPQAHFSFLHSL